MACKSHWKVTFPWIGLCKISSPPLCSAGLRKLLPAERKEGGQISQEGRSPSFYSTAFGKPPPAGRRKERSQISPPPHHELHQMNWFNNQGGLGRFVVYVIPQTSMNLYFPSSCPFLLCYDKSALNSNTQGKQRKYKIPVRLSHKFQDDETFYQHKSGGGDGRCFSYSLWIIKHEPRKLMRKLPHCPRLIRLKKHLRRCFFFY